MADNLRFVTVRKEVDGPLEIVGATSKGTLRVIPLSDGEALTVIKDLASHLRGKTRKEVARKMSQGDANGK